MFNAYQRSENRVFSDEMIEAARRAATDDALQHIPRQRDEEQASKVLRSKGSTALEPAKQKLRMSRKPRLRTVEQYLCDQCDGVIAKPTDGFIVHGNIYVADPSCRGGLIGNNFPEVPDDQPVPLETVKKTVLCKKCFLLALGFENGQAEDWTNLLRNAVAQNLSKSSPYHGRGRAV